MLSMQLFTVGTRGCLRHALADLTDSDWTACDDHSTRMSKQTHFEPLIILKIAFTLVTLHLSVPAVSSSARVFA
jgi:hypothetical protein